MIPLRGLILALGASAAFLAGGAAQAAGTVAIDAPGLKAAAALTVSIPAVAPGGVLPVGYTREGRNLSPALSWTPGPPATRSYAVIMQDPDAPRPEPLVHWIVYAIPQGLTALPRGMRNLAEPTHPLGVLQGLNGHDSFGYSGPQPPAGDPPHHYHFQVFALDQAPRLKPGARLAELERAMSGHVLAAGELVALYPSPTPAKTDRSASSPTG